MKTLMVQFNQSPLKTHFMCQQLKWEIPNKTKTSRCHSKTSLPHRNVQASSRDIKITNYEIKD